MNKKEIISSENEKLVLRKGYLIQTAILVISMYILDEQITGQLKTFNEKNR